MKYLLSSTNYVALIFIIFLPSICFSQVKSTYVGLNVISEFESSLANGTPGVGITIERQLTKHSGIESGIYYRTHIYNQTFITNSTVFSFSVSEKYISLPLLYKYYSRIVNLSAGATVDYFAGWSQKSGTDGLKVNSHSVDPNFAFGIMAKAGKSFPINKQLFIEPELRFNYIMPTLRNYFGIGVSLKYKL
ncbi:MAG: hypothetical protein ABIQ31_07715 [Ferruginibacter sp.]